MSECICGEINARNCPVHQAEPINARSLVEWQDYFLTYDENKELKDELTALKETNGRLRELINKVRFMATHGPLADLDTDLVRVIEEALSKIEVKS